MIASNAKGKRRRAASRAAGARVLTGSDEARQAAAVVLESVCGLCSVEEASARLGIAPPRYYVLETRALQGLIAALEPLPRGRRQTPQSKIEEIARENARLQRDLRRYQALHRAATRAMGIAPKPAGSADIPKAKKRRMRKRTRAERVVEILRRPTPEPAVAAAPEPPPAEVAT